MKILRISVLLLLSVVACTKATKPLPDKTTSWLRACDEDAQCGSELACLCGICSRGCDDATSCGGDTRCVQTDDREAARACGDAPLTPTLCASTCSNTPDCRELGTGFTCRNGLCAAPAAQAPPSETCDSSQCKAFDCPTGLTTVGTCSAGTLEPACGCAPDPDVTCKSGEVNMQRCDFVRCTGLNETAVTHCEAGHFSACECVVPRDGCAALDCASGYQCYAGKCLETARCTEQACEEGFSCWDGSVCGQVVANNQSQPYALALDSDALYFANRGTFAANGNFNGDSSIEKVNLATGEQVQLAGDKNPIRELVVDDARAYWFSEGSAEEFQLMSVPLRDGTPNAFLGGVRRGDSLVSNGESLYWFDRPTDGDPQLSRAPKDGSAQSRRITSQPASAAGLVFHRDHLYFADALQFWRATLDGSEVDALPQLDRTPRRLVANAEGIYWLWWTEAGATGVAIYDDGTGTNLILGMEAIDRSVNAAIAIAVFGDTVFWLVGSEEGYVVLNRTNKETGETRYVWGTPRLTAESRIVVNQDSIFVTNPGTNGSDGEVLRLVNWWWQ